MNGSLAGPPSPAVWSSGPTRRIMGPSESWEKQSSQPIGHGLSSPSHEGRRPCEQEVPTVGQQPQVAEIASMILWMSHMQWLAYAGRRAMGWAPGWSTEHFPEHVCPSPFLMEPTVVGCGTGHRAQLAYAQIEEQGLGLGGAGKLYWFEPLATVEHTLEKLSSKIGNGLRASCRWRMRRWMFDRSNRGSRTRKASAPCRGCCRLRFFSIDRAPWRKNHHARGCNGFRTTILYGGRSSVSSSTRSPRSFIGASCIRHDAIQPEGEVICLPWRAVALLDAQRGPSHRQGGLRSYPAREVAAEVGVWRRATSAPPLAEMSAAAVRARVRAPQRCRPGRWWWLTIPH